MRLVSAIISFVALSFLAGCGEAGWETRSDDPDYDLSFYGDVETAPNPGLRAMVEAIVAENRAGMSDLAAQDHDCRDFAYRLHLTVPDQVLVRCRESSFLLFRDGQPVSQIAWAV